MKTKIHTTILVFLFFTTSVSYSQDFWVSLANPPGNIFSLAIDNQNRIYAGLGSGVFRTNDLGVTWQFLGLNTKTVYSLAVDPSGNIFAGCNGVLYKSTDYGQTWLEKYNDIGNFICIATGNNGLMFCCCGSTNNVIVIRSFDYGETWQIVMTVSTTEQIYDILIASNDKIYAAATNFISGGGVYQSLNGGDTWANIGLSDHYVSSLAMNSSGDLFAGTRGHNQLGTGGVFILPAGQTGWTRIFDQRLVTSVVVNSRDEISIGLSTDDGGYGGVRRSIDDGTTWENISSGMGNVAVEKLILEHGEHLLAVGRWNSTALYRSVNSTVPAFILDGRVTYPNANGSSLSNIELALMQGDSLIRSAITNDAGQYSFDSLVNGMYTLAPSTSKPWGGVTAVDVLFYQKHIAGISPLSGLYLASGDVNGSGTITAVDMLLIKKRIAAVSNSFPVGNWLFNNEPIMITELNVTYNFNGICFGDANGSYVPPVK